MRHRKIKNVKELSGTDLQVSRILVELAVNKKQEFSVDFVTANMDKFVQLDKNLEVVSMAAFMQHQVDPDSKSSILLELMKNNDNYDNYDDVITEKEIKEYLDKVSYDKEGMQAILKGTVTYILDSLNAIPPDVLRSILSCLEKIKTFYDKDDNKNNEIIKDITTLIISLRDMEASCVKLNKFINSKYH